jgi:acetoin utilization deacetylase AcuC-like enzyme
MEPLFEATVQPPKVLNVGLDASADRMAWRDAMIRVVLPKLSAFHPNIILVSAGFDAHVKDEMNHGYLGLLEEDYEWMTRQLVKVANRCCQGRIVSVLEGGYAISGGPVSAFSRSVAAHVFALQSPTTEMWDTDVELVGGRSLEPVAVFARFQLYANTSPETLRNGSRVREAN